GAGVLVLDDAQWADPATLAAIPELARFVRLIVAVRTPAPLLDDGIDRLRAAAAAWHELGPLDDAAAARIAGDHPDLIAAAQGNPAVLTALSRGLGPTPPSIASLV